jgi:hypothetical protein
MSQYHRTPPTGETRTLPTLNGGLSCGHIDTQAVPVAFDIGPSDRDIFGHLAPSTASAWSVCLDRWAVAVDRKGRSSC